VTSDPQNRAGQPLDYAAPEIRALRPHAAVSAFACACAFVFSALFYASSGGLHNELDVELLLPWVVTGAATAVLWHAAYPKGAEIAQINVRFRQTAAIVFCLGFLLGSAAFVGRAFGEDPHVRGRCSSNLRSIGQAVQMYANENRGNFPPDFATLLLTQDLTSEIYVCFATNDTRATGPTTQAIADQLSAGGHVSYVYVGRGLTLKSPADAVVAYEPAANHGKAGCVLYADGHVNWVKAAQMKKLVDELNAGHNPPRNAAD
jgi:hypothetical protein